MNHTFLAFFARFVALLVNELHVFGVFCAVRCPGAGAARSRSARGSGAEEVEDGEDLQSAYEHLQGAGNQQTAFPSMKKRSAQEIILKSSEFI